MHVEPPAEVGKKSPARILFLQGMAQKIHHRTEIPILFTVIESARMKIQRVYAGRFDIIDREVKA